MKNKDFDDLNLFEKKTDKATEIIASIGMSAGISSFSSLIPNISSDAYLSIMTGGTILLSPVIYFGMKKIKNKMDDRLERDMHHAAQMMLMLQEGTSADHTITKSSSLFLHELHQEQEKLKIKVKESDQMHVSQFVYLINANYYDEIIKTFPTLNREEIVRRLITIILEYLKETNKNTFDEKDTKIILDRCLFIKEDLKEQIQKEFKKSKVRFGKTKFYEVVRKDTDSSFESYEELRKSDEELQAPNFDIESLGNIMYVIKGYSENEQMQELGNTNLEWDYDFLQKILTLISIKYRHQLVKEHGEYHNNFNLAASFVYNALSYAAVNNRSQVGYQEMLNAFKNWRYIPFKLQLEILDDLFEQENLSYEDHPYKISKKRKNPEKIIKIDFTRNK